jgi:hypothetical protein
LSYYTSTKIFITYKLDIDFINKIKDKFDRIYIITDNIEEYNKALDEYEHDDFKFYVFIYKHKWNSLSYILNQLNESCIVEIEDKDILKTISIIFEYEMRKNIIVLTNSEIDDIILPQIEDYNEYNKYHHDAYNLLINKFFIRNEFSKIEKYEIQ